MMKTVTHVEHYATALATLRPDDTQSANIRRTRLIMSHH